MGGGLGNGGGPFGQNSNHGIVFIDGHKGHPAVFDGNGIGSTTADHQAAQKGAVAKIYFSLTQILGEGYGIGI